MRQERDEWGTDSSRGRRKTVSGPAPKYGDSGFARITCGNRQAHVSESRRGAPAVVTHFRPGPPARRLVLPKGIEDWSLTSLQQRLVKTGGRQVIMSLLLADAGRRAPDANAVRCDDATDRAVAPSGKLTMIARPNQIAKEKEEERVSEKSTRKAPDYAVEPRAARNRSVFRRNCSIGLAIPIGSGTI